MFLLSDTQIINETFLEDFACSRDATVRPFREKHIQESLLCFGLRFMHGHTILKSPDKNINRSTPLCSLALATLVTKRLRTRRTRPFCGSLARVPSAAPFARPGVSLVAPVASRTSTTSSTLARRSAAPSAGRVEGAGLMADRGLLLHLGWLTAWILRVVR